MLQPRQSHGACFLKDTLYLVGGYRVKDGDSNRSMITSIEFRDFVRREPWSQLILNGNGTGSRNQPVVCAISDT